MDLLAKTICQFYPAVVQCPVVRCSVFRRAVDRCTVSPEVKAVVELADRQHQTDSKSFLFPHKR